MVAGSIAMPIYSSKEGEGSRSDLESTNKENENNTNKKNGWQRFQTRQSATVAGNATGVTRPDGKPSAHHEQVIRLIRNQQEKTKRRSQQHDNGIAPQPTLKRIFNSGNLFTNITHNKH